MVLLALLGAVLLLSGCNRQSNRRILSADARYTRHAARRSGCIPYTKGDTWLQVNIDDDTEVEYLLFYTYSNQRAGQLSGPVGASIFDLQNNDELVPRARIVSMPFQPSGSFVPYRVLPNYWQGSGTGFIAPSGRSGQPDRDPIERSQATNSAAPTPTPTPTPETDDNPARPTPTIALTTVPVKELLIEDGGTTITVVWWRNLFDGYGAANAHAAAGFKNQVYEKERVIPLRR